MIHIRQSIPLAIKTPVKDLWLSDNPEVVWGRIYYFMMIRRVSPPPDTGELPKSGSEENHDRFRRSVRTVQT